MDSNQRLEAVLALAREFNYDAEHSHQVECLAGTLFIELADYHQLERSDRKLLEYAAILHDIGYHVSSAGHHKHSMMLILTEPLPPFARNEVRIIANVARYHRKGLPTIEHTLYGALSEQDRRRVDFMAGMLRVADALDRSHKSLVRELTCSITEDEVILQIVAEHDLPVEAAAVARRCDLFRQVFRKTPRLDVQLPKLTGPEAVYAVA